jgi:hypothetical protein
MNNTNHNQRAMLRSMVRGSYDLQKLRIESGNRLVATFKAKLGHEPGTKETDTIDEEGQSLLDELKATYKRLTEGVVDKLPSRRKWKGEDRLISTYTEACLIQQYLKLEAAEVEQFKHLGGTLEDFAVYNEFLKGVKGCGLAMSAVIIGEFDISKATYASSLWKYAGLDVVVANGDQPAAGRSRRKEHLRTVQYTNKDGKPAERVGITFNPFLKTKLTGVLAPCFLKSNSVPYAETYRNYKHRLESDPRWAEKTKAHRHNAAMRYMIKQFLADLYAAWRRLEGLPVFPPYSEAKLGIRHRKAA